MPDRPRRTGWPAAPLAAVALAALWLVAPLGMTGVSDPYEADAADVARRIAVHAFGAEDLARPSDPAVSPTLTDVGMGELAYTAMALSFKLFGFSEWAGRLPMALFGLAGALALYAFLHRLAGTKAAFFSVVVLATTPLYFLHARTMTGEIATMAAFSIAVFGLTTALVEARTRDRAVALALGAAGLVAGFMARGLLIGVAAPLAAAAIAGLASPAPFARARAARTLAGGFGAASVATGALFLHVASPLVGAGEPLARLIGAHLHDPTPRDSTFDRMIRQLGYALFPWSLVAPLAIARAGAGGAEGDARAGFAKLVLLSGAVVSFLVYTFLVPWTGALPFGGVAMLAGAIGVMAAERDDRSPSRLDAMFLAAVALVLLVDFDREPSRTLSAFGPQPPAFPITFAEPARDRLTLALAPAMLAFFLLFDGTPATTNPGLGVRDSLARWAQARRSDAASLGRAIVSAFRGNVVFAAVVIEAWLVGQAAMVAIGSRAGWEQVRRLPVGAVRVLVNAWWAVPLAVVGAAVGYVLVRDGIRALSARTRLSRGSLLVIALGAAGAQMSLAYYPALGEQLTPRGAFDVYKTVRKEGEPLALLGTSPRAGALYFTDPLPTFTDVGDASAWLAEEGAERRFLLLKAKDLPRFNSIWRARYKRSVGVLDARSSQNVLVSNVGGERLGGDPFGDFLFDQPPRVAHPIHARLMEHIEVLGWEIVDRDGRVVDAVVPRERYTARVVLRVEKRVPGSWMTFVHLDGHKKRYNADHAPIAGRYPMNLWQPGDILRDEVEITLEPNFVPGEYWLFFGFFQGDTRMRVTDGPSRDDRVILGRVEVQ